MMVQSCTTSLDITQCLKIVELKQMIILGGATVSEAKNVTKSLKNGYLLGLIAIFAIKN